METEGHRAIGQFHPELFQHFCEQGVIPVVHDDEPGIDSQSGIGTAFDFQGAGVSTEIAVLFKEVHLVLAAQQPCGRESGHAAAHDCDLPAMGGGVHLKL